MYGPVAGGLPPAAAGGVLASTGSAGLGLAAATGTALLMAGLVLLRRARLATGDSEAAKDREDQAP